MRLRMLVLMAALTAPRCASLETHHYVTGKPGAGHHGPVAVFLEGAPLPDSYEEIGLVQVVASDGSNIAKLLPALKDEAASLGADAILLVRVDQGANHASATGVAVRTSNPAARQGVPAISK
jgi:hypothetical protein